MNKFNKIFLGKIKAGLMVDAMTMVNDGFKKALHGTVPRQMKDSFVKERDADEQTKIEKEVRKFEAMIEAGGLETAMDEINKGWREAAKRERKEVYRQ